MLSSYLSQEQVYEIVNENRYPISEPKLRGRCFSGEFKNEKNLPGLSLPGGDLGQLVILFSTAQNYGFEIDMNKAAGELFQLAGGNEHLHTSSAKSELKNCSYFKHLFEDVASYNLGTDFLPNFADLITSVVPFFETPKNRNYLHEHAVLLFESSQGLYPQYTFKTYEGTFDSRILILHKTLVDERHRILSQKLLESKSVTLYDNLEADYLYEVLSETMEMHLYETVRFIDSKLPIYSVKVSEDNDITINQL